MTFKLHPRLSEDCFELGIFPLCRLLLMNDCRYPWFILVPEYEDIGEIYQLSSADQKQLNKESCYLAKQMADVFHADKINIAALGNVVPQLHIHHIVRYKTDQAWPAPIWGAGDTVPYAETDLEHIRQQALTILKNFKAL